MSTPQPVFGRLERDGQVLWSIRIEPAPRLDPVLVLVGGELPAVNGARSLLKSLHPDRPAACVLVDSEPRLLSPVGRGPRCLPRIELFQGTSPGDLAAAVELAWGELARCSDSIGRAMPAVGARLVVVGGPWDEAGEDSLVEMSALGITPTRIGPEQLLAGRSTPSDAPLAIDLSELLEPSAAEDPGPSPAVQDALADLGATSPEVRGRLEVSLAQAPTRWWLWDGGSLRGGTDHPLPSLELPLSSVTVVLAGPADPEGVVRVDLDDGTPLVTAIDPAAAGEIEPELLTRLGDAT